MKSASDMIYDLHKQAINKALKDSYNEFERLQEISKSPAIKKRLQKILDELTNAAIDLGLQGE